MVEAGVAFFLLVFIVWWTMYSGPKHTTQEQENPESQAKAPDQLDTPPR
jgi:hypothetical protein